jgi:cytochrome c peroxidase
MKPILISLVAGTLLLAGCQQGSEPAASGSAPKSTRQLAGGLGPLPPVEHPVDNPMTPEKVELGKMLYFDTRLSGTERVSCATCHNPSFGWGEGVALSVGVGDQLLGRHSPTVLNAAYYTHQFWDGRAATLEEQAKGPITSKVEMNADPDVVVKRLQGIPDYAERFQQVFGEPVSFDNIAKAIATYERTVVRGDSAFDRWAAGDDAAMSEEAKRGYQLYTTKALCITCHSGPNFSDSKFHNIGVKGSGTTDKGRFDVTKNPADLGAFKTPTVRNAALTAPYMHDGSIATLEELVEHYDKGGEAVPNKSPLMVPLKLTAQEKADLVAFMKALTGAPMADQTLPELPY